MTMTKPVTPVERELRKLHAQLGHLSRFQPENTEGRAQLLRQVGALKLINALNKGITQTPITTDERNRLLAVVASAPVIDAATDDRISA